MTNQEFAEQLRMMQERLKEAVAKNDMSIVKKEIHYIEMQASALEDEDVGE